MNCSATLVPPRLRHILPLSNRCHEVCKTSLDQLPSYTTHNWRNSSLGGHFTTNNEKLNDRFHKTTRKKLEPNVQLGNSMCAAPSPSRDTEHLRCCANPHVHRDFLCRGKKRPPLAVLPNSMREDVSCPQSSGRKIKMSCVLIIEKKSRKSTAMTPTK